MSVRLNASGTVLGRIASYVWGPDVGSSWFARADWQRAGGVGGLVMILDGVSAPRYDCSRTQGGDWFSPHGPPQTLMRDAAASKCKRL